MNAGQALSLYTIVYHLTALQDHHRPPENYKGISCSIFGYCGQCVHHIHWIWKPYVWNLYRAVLAIPGCHLDYIWNQLQSRNDQHTWDPDLEVGRQVSDLEFDMETLRTGGHENLSTSKVANFRRLKQADRGQPRMKQVSDPGTVVHPLIWGTPSAGGLHKNTEEGRTRKKEDSLFDCLHSSARPSAGIYFQLLQRLS